MSTVYYFEGSKVSINDVIAFVERTNGYSITINSNSTGILSDGSSFFHIDWDENKMASTGVRYGANCVSEIIAALEERLGAILISEYEIDKYYSNQNQQNLVVIHVHKEDKMRASKYAEEANLEPVFIRQSRDEVALGALEALYWDLENAKTRMCNNWWIAAGLAKKSSQAIDDFIDEHELNVTIA